MFGYLLTIIIAFYIIALFMTIYHACQEDEPEGYEYPLYQHVDIGLALINLEHRYEKDHSS